MPVLNERSEPRDPSASGTCPVCGSDLLYVESLLVRQETRIAGVASEEFPDVGETWLFPILTDEKDSLVTERMSAYLSCSSMSCEYVFDSPLLGEPEQP